MAVAIIFVVNFFSCVTEFIEQLYEFHVYMHFILQNKKILKAEEQLHITAKIPRIFGGRSKYLLRIYRHCSCVQDIHIVPDLLAISKYRQITKNSFISITLLIHV